MTALAHTQTSGVIAKRAVVTRRNLLGGSAAALLAPFVIRNACAQELARATVLFDAFGKPSNLGRGWGYSIFIEHGGRRILFDTGGRSAEFANNASALSVDLKRLDFVTITHRHNDHTAGLGHVLRENPAVTIYTPFEGGGFNSPTPPALTNLITRQVAGVPDDLRYFSGNPPPQGGDGTPWPGAHFVQIGEPKEVLPGLFLFATRSERRGTMEMNEISMVVKTAKGGVLFVGCSHPGIEKILEAAVKITPQIYAVLGGFHLVDMADAQVTEMVMRFRDKWKIERMAAGHCTGQFAFAELVRIFGDNFDHAGVGSVVALPL
jgi:7,8-dihydropterin-6-yl-methyl-4-(beta-D-ribofuranosyl)aminobenzene 5'-phosphate synthase